MYIHCMYNVYTLYVHCIYNVYTLYIHCPHPSVTLGRGSGPSHWECMKPRRIPPNRVLTIAGLFCMSFYVGKSPLEPCATGSTKPGQPPRDNEEEEENPAFTANPPQSSHPGTKIIRSCPHSNNKGP